MGKTKPVVIADAGPIIQLDELGRLDLLADFGSDIALSAMIDPNQQIHFSVLHPPKKPF